jgi:hypothetical protein
MHDAIFGYKNQSSFINTVANVYRGKLTLFMQLIFHVYPSEPANSVRAAFFSVLELSSKTIYVLM